jgi:hypothetical protein
MCWIGNQTVLDAATLQHDPDPVAQLALAPGRVHSEDADFAAAPVAVPLEDLHGRRLAGPVGAEQAEHLSGGHVQADAAHRLHLAIGLAQVAHLHGEPFRMRVGQ